MFLLHHDPSSQMQECLFPLIHFAWALASCCFLDKDVLLKTSECVLSLISFFWCVFILCISEECSCSQVSHHRPRCSVPVPDTEGASEINTSCNEYRSAVKEKIYSYTARCCFWRLLSLWNAAQSPPLVSDEQYFWPLLYPLLSAASLTCSVECKMQDVHQVTALSHGHHILCVLFLFPFFLPDKNDVSSLFYDVKCVLLSFRPHCETGKDKKWLSGDSTSQSKLWKDWAGWEIINPVSFKKKNFHIQFICCILSPIQTGLNVHRVRG